MAFTVSTWTPASLQLRLALNYGSFRAPVKAKMVKPSRGVWRSCVAQNAESDPDLGGSHLDSSIGWCDSGDDEKNSNSRGGFWFKRTILSGVAGMILVVGLAFAALSLKRNV